MYSGGRLHGNDTRLLEATPGCNPSDGGVIIALEGSGSVVDRIKHSHDFIVIFLRVLP
jgi:hypothetical protein